MKNEYLTIKGQIELLKCRGLQISDEKDFYDFLLKNNYYRIKGYTLTLREQDVFHNDVNTDIIFDIYNADVEMRNLFMIQLIRLISK